MRELIESLIDPAWVFAQFRDNLGPMVVWTVSVFFAGFATGRAIRAESSPTFKADHMVVVSNSNIGDANEPDGLTEDDITEIEDAL